MSNATVTTKEKDYLEEDDPIRGQNYVCLSMINPEDILIEKEAFYFSKFLKQFSKDVGTLFDNLKLKFPDSADIIEAVRETNSYIFDEEQMDAQYKFSKANSMDEVEREFNEQHDFRTSVRGIKVRGVYDTIDEARHRCDVLRKKDGKFDIYVSQVGCWIPIAVNPNNIENQEWNETQLNTLMMNYNKNKEAKDQLFAERSKNANFTSNPIEELRDGEDPWLKKNAETKEVVEY
eukprot:762478-Hanusia_phi.AAC.2